MDIFRLPQDIFQDKALPRGSAATRSGTNRRFVVRRTDIRSLAQLGSIFLSAGNCMVSMELDTQMTMESILIFFDNKTLADFHLRYKERIMDARKRADQGVELFLALRTWRSGKRRRRM